MKLDYSNVVAELDEAIRAGQTKAAKSSLRQLRTSRVPREHVVSMANVAWRADMPEFGIRLLNPVVRPERRIPKKATEEEKAEYAQCLIRIGACEEGTSLLEELKEQSLPKFDLYRASAMFSQWDYESAVEPLRRYLKWEGLSSYEKLVGKTNLAAAYIYLREFDQSTPLMRELLYETSLFRNSLLFGVCLNLAAQNFALQKKWHEMERSLKKAHIPFSQTDTLEAFFMRKWEAMASYLSKPSASSIGRLDAIKREAKRRLHWETVRQIDEVMSVQMKDESLFHHVFFGTPYECFRQAMIRKYPATVEIPAEYVWRLKGRAKGKKILEIFSGEKLPSGDSLKPGQLLHRLFASLCSDFYRPLRIATLHYRTYPNEVYNPTTSPFRVYEGIKRLRQWFEANRLPLQIEESFGSYRLIATRTCAIRLPKGRNAMDKSAPALEKLKRVFQEDQFSLKEAANRLGIAERTMSRLLFDAVKTEKLVRTGKSRNVRYQIRKIG